LVKQYTINLLNFARRSNTIGMNNKFFLFKVTEIIYNPVKAWETIDLENKPVNIIRNSFLFPLILLVSIASVAGSLIFINPESTAVYSVFAGIKCFMLFYVSAYVSAYILKQITHALDLGDNFAISFKLIVYSIVPLLICQIFSRFFESVLFVNVLALSGLYVFWTGTEQMLTPPAYKKMPLLISVFITFVGVFIATDFLFTKVTDKIFHAFFS
jgi:hypothetical protein